MITCEILDTGKAIESIGDVLTTKFLPLLDEFWKKRGKVYYGTERWSPNMAQGIINLIASRGFFLMLASENGEVKGFIFGMRFQHLMTDKVSLLVEAWYGHTSEVEEAMFKDLSSGLEFLQVDSITLPVYDSPEVVHCVTHPEFFKLLFTKQDVREFIVRHR
jgi:hypothetical protein